MFAEAESLDAVLLFDEADALFGGKTEVKDPGVEDLLGRVHPRHGLAVLTVASRDVLRRLGAWFTYVIDLESDDEPD